MSGAFWRRDPTPGSGAREQGHRRRRGSREAERKATSWLSSPFSAVSQPWRRPTSTPCLTRRRTRRGCWTRWSATTPTASPRPRPPWAAGTAQGRQAAQDSIQRAAAAFGVHGVLIGKDRSAQVTPAVIRASAGLAYRVPVARVTNTSRALEDLKDAGFWAVGAVMGDAQPPWAIDFDMKTALVMGAEGSGIRKLVAENCDLRVEIPMAQGVDSLNVSASAAVLLYEIARSARQNR